MLPQNFTVFVNRLSQVKLLTVTTRTVDTSGVKLMGESSQDYS